ncbi:hypothetical protein [Natronorubrum daqingense]|uniref:Uncharacterized protein n=1 Tax=Natronorubrum daqingense TaxID=588898 RepID=A0A1N7G154_9EURY|nr:hypothetical protein [Natronorubrum daqingense]APX98625.1 hypothetical protein BB347_18200 [Natronorubrum daqingense]SIS06333.1 hypothetical protein SAMN05421809_3656 [Natronorubrum daqingense]
MNRETGHNGDHDGADAQYSQALTVDIFQSYRGNRREEQRAADTEQLRHDVRYNDQSTLSFAEFNRLYDHAGSDEIPAKRNPDLLRVVSALWPRWNRGSGKESPAFIDAETRSLEIGDVAAVGETLYLMTPGGWSEIELEVDP